MRILIDIGHPAHVHVFAEPIRLLQAEGHDLLVTSRQKDVALDLLDELGVPHRPLSVARSGLLGFARELLARDLALVRMVREFRPARMAGVGGTFIAHAGRLTAVPSLVFYDTESALLQNAITYRGYTDELEARYGLVSNVRQLDPALRERAIDHTLARPATHWQATRQRQALTTRAHPTDLSRRHPRHQRIKPAPPASPSLPRTQAFNANCRYQRRSAPPPNARQDRTEQSGNQSRIGRHHHEHLTNRQVASDHPTPEHAGVASRAASRAYTADR